MDNPDKKPEETDGRATRGRIPLPFDTATFRPIFLLLERLKTLQTQTLLFTLALLLSLGGVTVVLGAWVTHRLKQHLVEEAHEYAREEVVKSCREIQDIMRRKGLDTMESAAALPEVSQRIRMVLTRSDKTIQMVAILKPDGTTIKQYENDRVSSVREVGSNAVVHGELDGGKTNYVLTLERINPPEPAPGAVAKSDVPDRPAGYLAFQMANDLSGSDRVRRLSGAVTDSLRWMALLILAILALAMALLHKVFTRHLALEKEKDAQVKLAAIGALASGLAHEIRNPLQVIDMNLEVIREDIEEGQSGLDAADRARTARVLSGVQTQITHLNRVLRDFMQFAIPGRMEKEDLSLSTVIGDTLEFLGPELARNGVEVKNLVPESARIQGDPSALRQVFLNIFLNAVKAMENAAERRLTIGAEETRTGEWQIGFEDTGCGIPEGKEEEIFDAFVSFRAGGTGFGLAIARRIIEEHGGRIQADRRKPGSGALIRITLPGLETDAPAHQARQRSNAQASQVS